MNVFLMMAIIFAIFIAVDIISPKLLKVKRTALRNISLGVLCALTIASGVGYGLSIAKKANSTLQILYNAYNYLMKGNIEKAIENAEKVRDPHAEIILMLGDCWQDNYASAFIRADDLLENGKLNEDLMDEVDAIYDLSRIMTGLDGQPLSDEEAHKELEDIAEDCFALLEISEESEVEFLSAFERDSLINSESYHETDEKALRKMLSKAPKDVELLRYSVKYYSAMGDLDTAEENARKLLETDRSVDNIVFYTDVIAQKLMNDIAITTYDEDDPEIAELMEKAEDAQRAAQKYEIDNPRYAENMEKAEKYRNKANQVIAKRIINWLNAQMPLFGDASGVIKLQLSKLYAAAGEEEKAREILNDLLKHPDQISEDSPIKDALTELGAVYFDTSASDDDISGAIVKVLKADAFLPDSVLGRGYSQFLNKLLKYERVSIFISRVNADNYPTVRAYLNVNGKKDGVEELANDFDIGDFTFSDNGFAIANEKVKRITDDTNNMISIALVIDGSGSMEGQRIMNAKQAVEACIRNLDPETQELSIVIYENQGRILTPLTNDPKKLAQGVEQIYASGGTVISSGLMTGIESLKSATGTKAIILMTDGEDGSPETMDDAIAAAQAENIAVFTVSTGGGDREYMENIARQTGGSYMEAVTDAELVNVYTALQNFIVNNYCFEYTVEEHPEANPRILTIGLVDYEVASSRAYAYGGLVLTKDGSYISRAESGTLRMLYAEPSVVSAKDTELGIPVFISAAGVTDGAKVFVNGTEIKDAKIMGNSAISFTLSGKFKPGPLNVTVQLADGTTKSSDKLISISEASGRKLAGQTIMLGNNGNMIYADKVEQKDDYTLKLSGNVILNGYIRTPSTVTLYSKNPITVGSGKIMVSSGSMSATDAAYIDFNPSGTDSLNYGALAFGSGSVKVLDSFGFSFDERSIWLSYPGATLTLPGFGTVYGEAQFNGSEFVYTVYSGYMLSDLQNNLNYALNGTPLPQNMASNAAKLITGYASQNQYNPYGSYGLYAQTNELTVIIGKDYASVSGTGTISGYLGLIEVTGGKLTIDTTNSDSMYTISGTLKLNRLYKSLNLDGQGNISITASGLYPDKVTINANNFNINADGLAECFTKDMPPKALTGSMKVDFPLSISNEPYRSQVSEILADVLLDCDAIEFICTDDWAQNGIKTYSSKDPTQYVRITGDSLIIPIHCMDELSLFGTDLGGEVTGTATVNDWSIDLNLSVDGHLDNAYFGIKHDGKASMTVQLTRNARQGRTFPVTITYGDKTLTYEASTTGGISLQNGFDAYLEDDGQ